MTRSSVIYFYYLSLNIPPIVETHMVKQLRCIVIDHKDSNFITKWCKTIQIKLKEFTSEVDTKQTYTFLPFDTQNQR